MHTAPAFPTSRSDYTHDTYYPRCSYRDCIELGFTGRLLILDRLWGDYDPISLLASVSGIGKVLAERVHSELGIDSLEELERAVHAGRLAGVKGRGEKRRAGILDSLATRLGRVRTPSRLPAVYEPSIEKLLDVDREYWEKAEAGK